MAALRRLLAAAAALLAASPSPAAGHRAQAQHTDGSLDAGAACPSLLEARGTAGCTQVSAEEQMARVALLFERLPKLLGNKKKIKNHKLFLEFPNFLHVAREIVDGFLAGGETYYCTIENKLKQLVPPGEEREKYSKLFAGTRAPGDDGPFESVSAFLVTADGMLVAKPLPEEDEGPRVAVEVPRGTVEAIDQPSETRREAAAVREAEEELGIFFDSPPVGVRAIAQKKAARVAMPNVARQALEQLQDFAKNLTKLPKSTGEHLNAFAKLKSYGGLLSLLEKLGGWFGTKDWTLLLVPVPAWADFKKTKSVRSALGKGKLVALPLDGSQDFKISEGLKSEAALIEEGWAASGLPAAAAAALRRAVSSAA